MEVVRTRDVVIFVSDLTIPVMLDDAMIQAGWVGGTGVRWVPSPDDNFLATTSDGTYGGFLIDGSSEETNQYSSYTNNQLTYRFGVVGTGTWVISTIAFEKYTLQSRLAPPLVPNIFIVGQRLTFSLRGLWTPQLVPFDEWSIIGDPRAPNNFLVGSIIQAPGPENNYYLTVQTAI